MDALERAGLECPRDVSITGFNDVAFMDRLTPPLTTVRVPFTEMGAEPLDVSWSGSRINHRHRLSRCFR